MKQLIPYVVVGLVMFVLGMLTDHAIWSPAAPKMETAAPAVVLAPTNEAPHGAVMAERAPDTQAKPAQAIPKAYKVQRIEKVTVQPAAPAVAGEPCMPVNVDMSLVKGDGGERVIVSSPDGEISKAIDIPVAPTVEPARPKWAAGASYAIAGGRYGAWLQRDVGPLVAGAAVLQDRDGAITPWVSVGIRF